MIQGRLFLVSGFTRLVSPLRVGLHNLRGAWLRCNSLEWNNHSAYPRGVGRGCKAAEAATATLSSRLALQTAHSNPVNRRF